MSSLRTLLIAGASAGLLLSAGAAVAGSPAKSPLKAPPMTSQDKSDLAAVLALAPAGQPTALDMSNPVHYRFFVRQMKAAGVTPDRYPQLFKVTEQARKAKPPAVERRPMTVLAAQGLPGITPIQTLTAIGTDDGTNYFASAISSVPQTPYFSQLVVQLYDSGGNPIGQPASSSSATQPASNVNAIANGASSTSYAAVQGVATYFWQDQFGKAYHGFVEGVVTTAPTSITNLAPMPGTGQSITKLCLGRTGTDCTYSPPGGTGTNVLMPVQGSITFASAINTSPSTQTSLITMARPDTGQGGGCTIASTDNFFADPNTVINGGTISWNLNPAHFQPAVGCLVPNSTAIYTLTLGLAVANQATFVTITSDPNTDPQDPYFKIIPELQVFFSCLAEGTLVTLADGSKVAIEDLKEGALVRVAGGRTLAVESKLKGTEEAPMIRLKTAGGREVLITDGHPVIVAGKPVLAGLVRVGQKVTIEGGVDAVVSVEREAYAKPVWNLNLGAPPASLNDPKVTGSAFYAGGILVGDNVMQFVENRKQQKARAAVAVQRVPPEWRQDVVSAIKDGN
ncbi:Hint domain-containing protein [Caulobacter mirabilis]|uniref:Hint domain-containing protein n=1 Tax=Caulobacter mirabilis TaxID=69666 RepID=A0A2D2AWL8_9CAUL|nr:Hint domain-containing protein [Caulobacter mirabilis]ATQ42408.1 hypothetical protein CSW64_08265 [Caulobacter mirabilis]